MPIYCMSEKSYHTTTMNHPRAMTVISRNCSQNATTNNNTCSNSTAQHFLPPNIQGSWFSRFIQKIPGGSWLKTKLGRLIYGPTYAMKPSELKAYILSQKRALQLGYLRQEKEAQFKVAKYMALQYPDFYWSKYIDKLDKGSEERKRGFFLFVLTNKEQYGQYYGRYTRHIGLVNDEFMDMGLKAASMNIVKDIVQEKDVKTRNERNRRKKRGVQSAFESLSGDERRLFAEMDKVVNGIDISFLESKLQPLPSEVVMKRSPKARSYQKKNENEV
jgi:hypothetical protein